MPLVKVKDNEYFDYALRRFNGLVRRLVLSMNTVKKSSMKNLLKKRNEKKQLLLNEKKNVFLENVIAQEDSINSKLCPYSNNFKNT